jgi:hypothetical protein
MPKGIHINLNVLLKLMNIHDVLEPASGLEPLTY